MQGAKDFLKADKDVLKKIKKEVMEKMKEA
jgi:hypothetical protein